MTLTPEQFNKLVTRDEFNKLVEDVGEIKGDVKKILTAVDGIAKKHETFEQELASNQAAHDRFQVDIDKLKVHARLQA
ncbi:hypothetical protein A2477_02530 [Candidatus Falkowbacteria bacterium RIFOXYC2_FULL_47_12]|uniref:Uncharacterized protein n=2 Tax=Candidatus Falkowiibacteriota TaxID=1752728 RepID=A0A1F5TPW5_9BACT|nr:MAG: hypothetical protein A2242_02730 [Candidatus Falkowbacteria bacterium RIFOXYA2_FULL_47_9]OGF40960.1 MAG: hypothetical protein A2477_02530 [Candidatus Falkowbacteria bacterium RIFOXYC2_FULL_47_12]